MLPLTAGLIADSVYRCGVGKTAGSFLDGMNPFAGENLQDSGQRMGTLLGTAALEGMRFAEAPGAKTNCFPAGTLVALQGGTFKPIETLTEKDVPATRDPVTCESKGGTITHTFKRTVYELTTAEFTRDGDTSGKVVETITGTVNHPFFVAGKGFVLLSELGVGNKIVTRAGPYLVVKSVKTEKKPEGVAVYNFEVAGSHTYFVGKTNGGAWVHNDCGFSFFDTMLEPTSYPGVSRGRHFQEANRNLLAAMLQRPRLAAILEKHSPGLQAWLENGGNATPWRSPPGFTWHHHQTPGRMQLAPRWLHRTVGWNTYHPDNVGGYDIWGEL